MLLCGKRHMEESLDVHMKIYESKIIIFLWFNNVYYDTIQQLNLVLSQKISMHTNFLTSFENWLYFTNNYIPC